jgi:uncharacterized protein YkwD
MKRSGGKSFIVLVVVLCAAAFAQSRASASTQQMAASLVASVNAARAQTGLPALRRTRALDESALLKAEEIRSCGQFSHTPCGISFTQTFRRTGYYRGRVRVGENLYWGTGGLGSPASALAAWLTSPPHRANLFGRWRDTGVGVVHASTLFGHSDVWLYVLEFGRRD